MSKLEELKKLKAAYEEALATTAKDIIKEVLESWFEENPKAAAVRWQQYTPYFNDGDPCVFGLRGFYMSETENPEDWDYIDDIPGLLREVVETLGDGVEITVTRDLTMTVEDIDHD